MLVVYPLPAAAPAACLLPPTHPTTFVLFLSFSSACRAVPGLAAGAELDFGNFQDLATMKETMEVRSFTLGSNGGQGHCPWLCIADADAAPHVHPPSFSNLALSSSIHAAPQPRDRPCAKAEFRNGDVDARPSSVKHRTAPHHNGAGLALCRPPGLVLCLDAGASLPCEST